MQRTWFGKLVSFAARPIVRLTKFQPANEASVSKPLISIYTRITKIIVIAPSPPPDLVATRSGAKVQLVWNKSATATP